MIYTQAELRRAQAAGNVTPNGVAYLEWDTGEPCGKAFAVLREPEHTSDQIHDARVHLLRTRFVSGLYTYHAKEAAA